MLRLQLRVILRLKYTRMLTLRLQVTLRLRRWLRLRRHSIRLSHSLAWLLERILPPSQPLASGQMPSIRRASALRPSYLGEGKDQGAV